MHATNAAIFRVFPSTGCAVAYNIVEAGGNIGPEEIVFESFCTLDAGRSVLQMVSRATSLVCVFEETEITRFDLRHP